jgi:hypothetical protein
MSVFHPKKGRIVNQRGGKPERRKVTGQNQKARRAFVQAEASSASPADILDCQRTFGNAAVNRAIELSQNAHHADRPGQFAFNEQIKAERGRGDVLPDGIRRRVERETHQQLGSVRIHTDERSDRLARSANSLAFTAGSDIFFSQGQYNPKSAQGVGLLRHELTHVIQQGGQFTNDMRMGKRESEGEREANRYGQAYHSANQPTPYSATGSIQRFWFPWQKEKAKSLGGGSFNKVFRVLHRGGGTGYFKPDTEREDEDNPASPIKAKSNMGARAVLSSDIDQTLGLNVLSKEKYRTLNGMSGSESSEVGGEAITSNRFENPISKAEYKANRKGGSASMYKKKKGFFRNKYFQYSGTDYQRHDFTNSNTQKDLANIQFEDLLTGQRDRHGGNVKIDSNTGHAKGYDNDLMTINTQSNLRGIANLHRGTEQVQVPDGEGGTKTVTRKKQLSEAEQAARAEARKNARMKLGAVNANLGNNFMSGLPSHVDEATAQKVIGTKSQVFMNQLIARNPENAARMDPEHMQELKERYSATRRFVKEGFLPADQRRPDSPNIVSAAQGGWNMDTYNQQLSVRDPKRAENAPNYLQRGVRQYNKLMDTGGTKVQGDMSFHAINSHLGRLPAPVPPAPAAGPAAVAGPAAGPMAGPAVIPAPNNMAASGPGQQVIQPPITNFSPALESDAPKPSLTKFANLFNL